MCDSEADDAVGIELVRRPGGVGAVEWDLEVSFEVKGRFVCNLFDVNGPFRYSRCKAIVDLLGWPCAL